MSEKADMYEDMIKSQVTGEIQAVREMLAGVVGLLDKNTLQQGKSE